MVKQFVFNTNDFSTEQPCEIINSTQPIGSIEEAQKIIYCFLVDIVKTWSPELVLQEFQHLFIQDNELSISNPARAIYEIIFTNSQEEFYYTIKRSCYILINNWIAKRRHKYLQKLIEIFNDPIIKRKSLSPMIERLRNWIQIFISSRDFQELELYTQAKIQEQACWSERYTSYLLATQYNDIKNPIEQREAARNRAQQLKYRFKFDLAMYMVRFESANASYQLKNPTEVGDEVLRIIKIIVTKRDTFSYANLADTFVKQAREQNYKKFKYSLQKYLICSGESQTFVDTLNLSLSKKLDELYAYNHEKPLNDVMLLKTCNKLINYLTTENRRQPSQLLVSLMSQGHPLTVVVLLLKIVLICKPARTHLEAGIADLIRYHEKSAETCSWMINFIEIFNIIFAIYADNMLLQL
jgi:hypothetical protein